MAMPDVRTVLCGTTGTAPTDRAQSTRSDKIRAKTMMNGTDHFQAAVELIEPHADDHETLVDAIEDRTYEEVDIRVRMLDEQLYKFEIDASELDVEADWLRNEFKAHDYKVYNIADRRFTDDVDRDRLLIVVTERATPVRQDRSENE